MNLNTGGTMVAIGTSMTNINNGIAELIILIDHWATNGSGDMTQEQGFQLAGLVSPFIALLYARLGVELGAGNDPVDMAPSPPPAKAVAAIIAMFLIAGGSMIFGPHLRSL